MKVWASKPAARGWLCVGLPIFELLLSQSAFSTKRQDFSSTCMAAPGGILAQAPKRKRSSDAVSECTHTTECTDVSNAVIDERLATAAYELAASQELMRQRTHLAAACCQRQPLLHACPALGAPFGPTPSLQLLRFTTTRCVCIVCLCYRAQALADKRAQHAAQKLEVRSCHVWLVLCHACCCACSGVFLFAFFNAYRSTTKSPC